MIGHLGHRVSALLDGQLSPRDSEEAWAHVYTCHACRDLVEREGWIKTRLAGLGTGAREASADLKGSLLSLPPGGPPRDGFGAEAFGPDGVGHAERGPAVRRTVGVAALGGGAVGAAMLGVLAFGLGSGSTPPADRRPPVTQINNSTVQPSVPTRSTPVPATRFAPATGGSDVHIPTQVRRILP